MPSKTAGKTRSRKTRARTLSGREAERRPDPASGAVVRNPGTWPLWIGCLFLVFATLALYSPVGNHPFVNYDDESYVVHNAHVQAGLSWDTLTWAWTATENQNWHPLTWLSHALDCQLFGLNASGHHWTNVVIHTANVVFLFLLLLRATGARGPSLLVAALFAIHPLNVESVAWVAERKNVLSTLFFLLALGAYGWYAQKPGVRRYLALTLLFLLGLAAKPMVITLPFVLLLLDYWPLQRIEGWSAPAAAFRVPQSRFSRLVVEKLPLLVFSAASAVITIKAQGDVVVPVSVLPFFTRLEDAFYAYGMYLWKAFWPASLAVVYPHPGRTLAAWQPGLALLTIATVSAAVWKLRSTRPYLVVGWLWFLGTLVPVSGIVQVGMQVMADRYAYVPLLGIFVIVAFGTEQLALRFGMKPRSQMAAAAVVLMALSVISWRQIGYWQSNYDLWSHTVQVTKNNSIAERSLANALLAEGRFAEAMPHLSNANKLEAQDPIAHFLWTRKP